MGVFVVRRLLVLAATLLCAALIVFAVMRVLPGDPAAIALGTGARPDTLQALRHAMGLDRPLAWQFATWLAGLLRGDWGDSASLRAPIARLVAERLPVSLPLALGAVVLSSAIAVPLGAWAAGRRGRASEAAVTGLAQVGVAVPNFWLGLLLILLFAVRLGWLPAGGFPGWRAGAGPALAALLLPLLALALPQAAVLARVARGAVAETLGQDFVRTARAKGLGRGAALWRHAVPNALVPIITVIGLQVSFLIAGAVIVENVFALPGLGRLLFQAIGERDLPLVQDLVVLLAGCVILVNFAVDLAAAALDPRLRG